MKLQVRTGVFETNSSSTHSITICTQKDFDAFKNGKKVICVYSLKLYDTVEEGLKKERWADEGSFRTYDGFNEYVSESWYENFEETFTTPGGEKVVAFGYYGHD